MKLPYLTLAALGLAAALTACAPKEETTAADPAQMETAPAAKMVKGTGTVTSVDAATGSVTLDHAPIPEAGWPAMTMAFKATPELARSVKAGDKVAFDLTLKDGGGELTAISKQ